VLELRFTHLYWLRAYCWWLLREYIPLVEKHRHLSIPVYVAARLTYNLVLGLLLVVDAARSCLKKLASKILLRERGGDGCKQ